MIDELRQIAIFSKTIDHGSFRGAARELKLSPSVVSHHISQLEEKLGVALIYRTTRRLTLTREGERLLVSAREMISAVNVTVNELRNTADMPSGHLNVTLPSVLSQSPIVDDIAAFQAAYPKITLNLGFSDLRQSLVNDGYDVAIRMSPKRDRAPNRRSLFQVERIVVAAPDYLTDFPPIDHPNDLAEMKWLELEQVQSRKTTWFKGSTKTVQTDAKVMLATNDAHALYRLARAGAGVAIVPDYLAQEDLQSGKVQRLLSDWSVASLDTYAEWPVNAPKGGIVDLLVSWLAKD